MRREFRGVISSLTMKSLIDCHVHLAAPPNGDDGCDISRKTLRGPLFRFLLWKHLLSPDTPRERIPMNCWPESPSTRNGATPSTNCIVVRTRELSW